MGFQGCLLTSICVYIYISLIESLLKMPSCHIGWIDTAGTLFYILQPHIASSLCKIYAQFPLIGGRITHLLGLYLMTLDKISDKHTHRYMYTHTHTHTYISLSLSLSESINASIEKFMYDIDPWFLWFSSSSHFVISGSGLQVERPSLWQGKLRARWSMRHRKPWSPPKLLGGFWEKFSLKIHFRSVV